MVPSTVRSGYVAIPALEAWRVSAGVMESALELGGVGWWAWEPTTDLAVWSPQLYVIFGRDPAKGAAVGDEFLAYVHPEDRVGVAAEYERWFGGGGEFSLECRIVRSDDVRHVLARGRRDRSDAGRCVGVVRDVTDERVAEHALRAQSAFANELLSGTPIGMAVAGPDGRMMRVNRALCELLGYADHELLAMSAVDVLHPDDRAAALDQHASVLGGGDPVVSVPRRFLHRSGRVIWVEASVRMLTTGQDAPAHLVVQIIDITARRDAEQAGAHLQALGDHVPDALTLGDADGVYPNCASALLGRSAEQIVGVPDREVLDGTARGRHRDADEHTTYEITVPTRDGRQDRQVIRYPVTDNGQLIGSGTIGIDTTTRKQSEAASGEQHELLATVLSAAPIGMALMRPDGRFIEVNTALCELLGYTPAELLNLSYRDITHPDDLDISDSLVDALRDGISGRIDIEKRYRHRDGRSVWAQLIVTVLRDERGAQRFYIAQIQDRTAARALAAASERLAAIVESSQDAIIGKTLAGTITSWNAGAQAIYGYTAGEMIGSSISRLAPTRT